MYFEALSFLEDERDAWAPFEALLGLSDDALERPTDPSGPGHGWSGRDLMSHLAAWQAGALQVARELAVGEHSATLARQEGDWATRGFDVINAALTDEWRALPLDEVRRRFRTTAGELRGYLTVVPETRWVKHSKHLEYFAENTLDHYTEHAPELAAVLVGAS